MYSLSLYKGQGVNFVHASVVTPKKFTMDIVIHQDKISVAQIIIYASASFLTVSMIGLALYATCSRKYRLNWFEKNLLETANVKEEDEQCRHMLIATTSGCNVDNVSECSRKGNQSPTSVNTEDTTFWVPSAAKTVQQQVSSSAEESPPPDTPTSPTGSLKSNSLSISSASSLPAGCSDKCMGLATARPKVSSMHAKLDYTKIDMNLYRTNSLQKSDTGQLDNSKGSLHLCITYDPNAGMLTIRLIEAQNLQPRDFSGTADPYAKIRLLPERKNFWQTRIHKKTLNPVFDEDFVFEESPKAISRRTVEVLLYDFDAYSRHVCIGGIQIPLASIDLTGRTKIWTPLGSCSEQDSKVDLGDVMITLAYLPSAERLTVVIIKARNLRIVDDSRNSSDPYIKVTLLAGGKKIKKRKTGVVRNNVNPVYNEALTFDLGKELLKAANIELTVVHDSLLGSNEILGRAVIGGGPDIRYEERIFFEEMFRSKSATAQWIPLQDVIQHNSKAINAN
uniref:C2 domain-containing protein n=1 Tax=Glossina pallidipes TaxID=7398 RepID=A0A1B0A9N4_GLOPL